jgi:thymidylate synthase ThyX
MASMTETPPTKTETPAAFESRNNQTEVFAVHGADPEVLAYAMAKYSRSSLSMKESLREISSQKAEQFLNTFYFQYGHRSIADLAHVAFAVERLSLLAAIVLVDEQRWDGQERSTRYQNFRKSGWYMLRLRYRIREPLSRNHRAPLRRLSQRFRGRVRLAAEPGAEAGRHEAGELRPHAEGAGL